MHFNSNSLDSFQNIPAAFFAACESYPNNLVYTQVGAESKNYLEVKSRTLKLASFLKSVGVKKGTTVAIISASRPQWLEADLATLFLGGVTVSVYPSLSSAEIAYILYDSNCEIIFAENQEQIDKLKVVYKQAQTIPETEDRKASKVSLNYKAIITFESVENSLVSTTLNSILNKDSVLEQKDHQGLTRNDLASIVYTSGTTGPPKGVLQTHGNHLANCRQACNARMLPFPREVKVMLFLPLAHSFAKLMGILGLVTPAVLCFTSIADKKSSKLNPAIMGRDISNANSTIIPIVPRLLEKMQSGIKAKINSGGLIGKLIALLVWSANNKGNPLAKILYILLAPIKLKIKKQLFGKKLQYCISGGAKLNPEVNKFFDNLGIRILEGYGLTETCVATNCNRIDDNKIGTVGPVLDRDIEIKIEADGEICYRGPNVSLGYHNRPTATKLAWSEDGWFHTGDLGVLDNEGFLAINGRKKEIIVTSYGKKITPEPVEALIKKSDLVSQAVLIGDDRPYCVALVTINVEAAKDLKTEEIKQKVTNDIMLATKELANFEQPKFVVICSEEFTIENGLLTPTFKVKRKLVEEKYKDLIKDNYRE